MPPRAPPLDPPLSRSNFQRETTSEQSIVISKNVVGENGGEWQLSNGDCSTERNCGFYTWYANMSSSRGAKLILP